MDTSSTLTVMGWDWILGPIGVGSVFCALACAYLWSTDERALWLNITRSAVVFVAVIGTWAFFSYRAAKTDYIRDYCRYGAVSQAQLDQCRDNVTVNDIDERDTNAAKFARDKIGCEPRAGRGPFCDDLY